MKVDRILFFEKKNNIDVNVYECNDIIGPLVLLNGKIKEGCPQQNYRACLKEDLKLFKIWISSIWLNTAS